MDSYPLDRRFIHWIGLIHWISYPPFEQPAPELYFFPLWRPFWLPTKAVAGKIQKLQNRAARVLSSTCYDTGTDFLLDKLGWKYLKTQRKIAKGTMLYKALNGLAPNYLACADVYRTK